MFEYILYFIITLIATTVCALTGMGGGVIIKPIMDMIGDFDVETIGIISSITVFSMALVSTVKHVKSKTKIPFNIALPLAFGSVVGGVAGEKVFELILSILNADSLVKVIQNVILAFLIFFVFIYINNKSRFKSKELKGAFSSFFTGLFLGTCAAFLGIGGGPINVTVIVFLFSLPIKTATVCSLITILFSQLAKLSAVFLSTGFTGLDFNIVLVMVVAAFFGGFLGAFFNKKLSEKTVERAFCSVVLVVLGLTVFNIIKNLI